MTIFFNVLTAHGRSILKGWTEGKLHRPLPVKNAFILVPANRPVPANVLQTNLSLFLGVFRRRVISKLNANGFGDASCIVGFLRSATFLLRSRPFCFVDVVKIWGLIPEA